MFGGCRAEIEKGQNCRDKRQDMNSFTGTPGLLELLVLIKVVFLSLWAQSEQFTLNAVCRNAFSAESAWTNRANVRGHNLVVLD